MVATRTIICNKCRNTVSIDVVRYDHAGENLICMPCYHRDIEVRKQQAVEKPRTISPKERLRCLRCNYKFAIKLNTRAALRCPYCASDAITRYEAITADAILKAVIERPEFVVER